MNLNQFDVSVLFSMSIAVVLMAMVFPHAGLADMDANESEIPDFNISTERFDWTGEFPDTPGNPTQGTLEYIENAQAGEDNRDVYLQRDPSGDDYLLALTNFNGTLANPVPTWELIQFNESGSVVDREQVEIEENETGDLEAGDFVVLVDEVEVENAGESNMTMRGDWEVIESPTVGGGISGTITQLSAVVGWIGTVLWWISATAVTTVLNILGILFDVVSFLIGLASWLISTYGAVISGAPTGWVATIVALPGILLSLALAKVVLVFASVLPFT